MTRTIVAACLALAVAVAAQAATRELNGAWTASVSERSPSKLQFSMQLGPHENNGSQFDRSEFTGLDAASVDSPTRVNAEFELRREAGTIAFEGSFRRGLGAGEFTFTPNPEFPRMLRSVGVRFEPKDGDEDREMFNLTVFDVSIAFIRSMQQIGYDVPLQKLVEFRIFDVNPEYVRDMTSVGFKSLTADKLVETRIHGATPDYIRKMRAAGDDLPLDKYIESRIFQITPEFAQEMGELGYPGLNRDMLTQFRIHGVTAEFIHDIGKLGYTHVPANQLVEMRIHGVTPEFIRRVSAAGYHRVPIEKLVQMRIFDIQPEMVKALDDGRKVD